MTCFWCSPDGINVLPHSKNTSKVIAAGPCQHLILYSPFLPHTALHQAHAGSPLPTPSTHKRTEVRTSHHSKHKVKRAATKQIDTHNMKLSLPTRYHPSRTRQQCWCPVQRKRTGGSCSDDRHWKWTTRATNSQQFASPFLLPAI
jgi:hypothetical protein